MLPLMYNLELADITFTIASLKAPQANFDINQFISSNTRSGLSCKLKHRHASSNLSRHSFFCRIPRLWNSLPPITPLSPYQQQNTTYYLSYSLISRLILILAISVPSTIYAHAIPAQPHQVSSATTDCSALSLIITILH